MIDQIKESTVIPLGVLRVGGRQGYVSVQSVYQYSFVLLRHLVDLAVILPGAETCIKLY